MKQTTTSMRSICFLLSALLSLMIATAQAQSSLPANPPNIDTPGLSIDSVIRYMRAGLSPDDTGEGEGAAQLAEFARTWKDRLTSKDS